MKTIYRLTAAGWIKVRTCQSFEQACSIARSLWQSTGIEHCVNT